MPFMTIYNSALLSMYDCCFSTFLLETIRLNVLCISLARIIFYVDEEQFTLKSKEMENEKYEEWRRSNNIYIYYFAKRFFKNRMKIQMRVEKSILNVIAGTRDKWVGFYLIQKAWQQIFSVSSEFSHSRDVRPSSWDKSLWGEKRPVVVAH
jgi:hypothetical protein